MSEELRAAVSSALEAGRGESLPTEPSCLVIVTLPSGARLGIDAQARYWIAPEDGSPASMFAAEKEGRFLEVIEIPRRDFEDLLEAGARALDLPVDPTVVAFPALELLGSVLGMPSGFAARLALRWLLPSERSPLLPAIVALISNGDMPQDVRDLARHLRG